MDFFTEKDCDVCFPITGLPMGSISLKQANRLLRERGQDRRCGMTDDQQGRLEEAARAQLVKAMRLNVGEDMFVAMFKAGAAWMKADIEANRDLTVEYLVGYSQGKADEAKRVAGLESALARCKEQRNDWQVAFGQIFEALGKKVPIEFDLKHILEQDAEIEALRTFTEIGG